MVLVIYTDGACSGNGTKNSRGGIGVHYPNGEYKDISICCPKEYVATNNNCELLAIIYALKSDDFSEKIIFSDSRYCVETLNSWLKKWKKDGTLNERPNIELFLEAEKLMERCKTELIYIRRSSHRGNCEADRLAGEGKKKTE
jgi:ribonuclease HI/DNA polymerase-3 subunit epsilon